MFSLHKQGVVPHLSNNCDTKFIGLACLVQDACFGMGSRTQAVSLGLWRSNAWTAALFFVEPLAVYTLWTRWRDSLEIINQEKWAYYAKIYWIGEIAYCNLSWYSFYPLSKMTWELLPAGSRLGENIYLLCLTIFSWV